MFLAATDICEHCRTTIYPNDEVFSFGMAPYHIECAEQLDLPDDSGEE